MIDIQIGWTEHFADKFHSTIHQASVILGLRELVQIVSNSSHHPVGEFTKGKPITGPLGIQFKKHGFQLRETRLNYSSRLLYAYANKKLELIEFDATPSHSIVDNLGRWSKSTINRMISSIHPAHKTFVDEVLGVTNRFELPSVDGGTRNAYAEELFDDWLMFLDAPQQQIRDTVVEILTEHAKDYSCTLILGGPGTGKTVVMSSVAYQLEILDIPTKFELPPGVREQLHSSGVFAPSPLSNWDVSLVDDPLSFDQLVTAVTEAKAKSRPLVVAIDPTQWQERKTIERFDEFLNIEKPEVLELRLGYRQGGAIGKSAIHAVETFLKKSSAYADQKRKDDERYKAKKWEDLCLRQLNFATNDGSFIMVNNTTDGNYLSEALKAIRQAAEFRTERTWPNILVAVSNERRLPPGVQTIVNSVQVRYPSLKLRKHTYKDVKKIRGTEFEAVIMFIEKSDWDALQRGLIGAGTADWERTSQILTFFTRAENVLAVLPILEDFSAEFAFEKNGKTGELRVVNKIFGTDMHKFTYGNESPTKP